MTFRTRRFVNRANHTSGGGAPTLLLDSLAATCVLAYSSRKLRSAFAGKPLQVRNSSGGGVTDIPFNGNDLDTSTGSGLNTVIGANTGTISKWYDQTTTGADATQGTAANQPRIRTASANDTINGHVAPLFDPSGTFSELDVGIIAVSQPLTVAICTKMVAFNSGGHITDGAGGVRILVGFNDATHYQMYAGTGPLVEGTGHADTTNVHTIICSFAAASAAAGFVDGTQSIASGDAGANTFASSQAIGDGQGNTPYNGYVCEYLVFNSAISSGDRGLIRSSWQTYWGAV